MKLIHTADWHLGKNIEGHSRVEEQRLFLKDFINICEEEQADIIIIAGDIYDNYNPSAMAEQLFYDTLKQLSRNGDCMTVVIAHPVCMARMRLQKALPAISMRLYMGKKRISFSFLFQVKNG